MSRKIKSDKIDILLVNFLDTEKSYPYKRYAFYPPSIQLQYTTECAVTYCEIIMMMERMMLYQLISKNIP